MSIRLAAMTLGCPAWDLLTICRQFRACGFDAIDFRGLNGEMDVTVSAPFTRDLAASRRLIADHGLLVSNISSSISLCDPTRLAANVEEARRTIGLARELGAGSVRVFGNGDLKAHDRTALAGFGAACMAEILALDGATSVRWGVETHDHWIKSTHCLALVDRIAHPAVGVLWDMGHTSRVGGETPADSFARYKGRIVNTHVKDATYDRAHPQAMADGWRYRLPGEGQLPLAAAVAQLKAGGYAGYITFEHEKKWHPELAEPEIAFPAAATWIRAQLNA